MTLSAHLSSPSRSHYDVLVVGAGFAGSVAAERLASIYGLGVHVIDRRPHIAGNAYDYYDDNGVLCHAYGPHIFHTNSDRVAEYLSEFTEWIPYEHRVVAEVDGRMVPIPINRTTINALYAAGLKDDESAQRWLKAQAVVLAEIKNSEDAVVTKVGRDLYERMFRGYTRKQWGLDPSELHASVCARIPTRTDENDRYFTDSFQKMPAEGYTALFKRILDHPNITVETAVAFQDAREQVSFDHLVWTGPIDEYFAHRFGPLPYRSLKFEYEVRDTEPGVLVQPVAQINYPNERIPYTRVTEFRHLTGQAAAKSVIAYEYPSAEGEPYYPIPRPQNRDLYHRYATLAEETDSDVLFVGRLARYQYLNMDQVVGNALASVERWPTMCLG